MTQQITTKKRTYRHYHSGTRGTEAYRKHHNQHGRYLELVFHPGKGWTYLVEFYRGGILFECHSSEFAGKFFATAQNADNEVEERIRDYNYRMATKQGAR